MADVIANFVVVDVKTTNFLLVCMADVIAMVADVIPLVCRLYYIVMVADVIATCS